MVVQRLNKTAQPRRDTRFAEGHRQQGSARGQDGAIREHHHVARLEEAFNLLGRLKRGTKLYRGIRIGFACEVGGQQRIHGLAGDPELASDVRARRAKRLNEGRQPLVPAELSDAEQYDRIWSNTQLIAGLRPCQRVWIRADVVRMEHHGEFAGMLLQVIPVDDCHACHVAVDDDAVRDPREQQREKPLETNEPLFMVCKIMDRPDNAGTGDPQEGNLHQKKHALDHRAPPGPFILRRNNVRLDKLEMNNIWSGGQCALREEVRIEQWNNAHATRLEALNQELPVRIFHGRMFREVPQRGHDVLDADTLICRRARWHPFRRASILFGWEAGQVQHACGSGVADTTSGSADAVRIGVDVSSWRDTRGFGRFTRELVTQLVLDGASSHEFVLVADADTAANAALPASVELSVAQTRPATTPDSGVLQRRSPLDLLRLGWCAAHCRADVFFFPAPSSFYPVLGRVPVVAAVHDTMTDDHPALFFSTRRDRLFWNLKMAVLRRQASAIVTPSENARQRVAAATGWSLDRITCIAEAPASSFVMRRDDADVTTLASHYGFPRGVPLVLYVGGIDPHKNIGNLLRAMALIRPDDPNGWHLVLVGAYQLGSARGYVEEVLALRDQLRLYDRVTLAGFVPDDDLARLYNAATLLVLPSLDEGFGLPVVEAMACGVPVAVSNRGSLPELVADAGLTFDPEQPHAIAASIRRLLDDDELQRALAARGLQRAKQYSWQRTAQQAMHVLACVVRGTS